MRILFVSFQIILIILFSKSVVGHAFTEQNDENGWSIVDFSYYGDTRIPAPKPISHERQVIPNRLGNIVVYRTVYHRGCGHSETGFLVICLRANGAMDEHDKREMLERIRSGSTVNVGSDMAKKFVYETIGTLEPVLEPVIEVINFNRCSGACDLRVEVHGGI